MYGLLDGDIVLFRCGFAAERTRWHLAYDPMFEYAPDGEARLFQGEFREHEDFEFKREATDRLDEVCPGIKSRVEGEDYKLWPEVQLEPLEYALQNVRTLVSRLCSECDISEFELKVAFSDKKTFRHTLAKTRPYKGSRKDSRRPTYEKEIKAYMKENYDCYTAENEEADDLLGIWATEYGPHGAVIISLDKDLDQIPGLKYNWLHDVHYDITEETGLYNFFTQLLMGDTTDDIVGLPGIGKGKAAKALHARGGWQEMFDEACLQYQVHSGEEDWYEYMVEMAQLVWIRRYEDEDIREKLDELYVNTGDNNDMFEVSELTLEVD